MIEVMDALLNSDCQSAMVQFFDATGSLAKTLARWADVHGFTVHRGHGASRNYSEVHIRPSVIVCVHDMRINNNIQDMGME